MFRRSKRNSTGNHEALLIRVQHWRSAKSLVKRCCSSSRRFSGSWLFVARLSVENPIWKMLPVSIGMWMHMYYCLAAN